MSKVALDIDSVLADFGSYFLDYLEIEDKSPAHEWNDPRFRDNFDKIKNDVFFWSTMPVLSDPSEITFDFDYYVTARPMPSDISHTWLIQNGFPDKPVLTVGHNGSKVQIMKDMGITLMLDDAIHNFEELNGNGITCYLFTRPHNLSLDTPLRVDSVKEFGKIVKNKPLSDLEKYESVNACETLKDLAAVIRKIGASEDGIKGRNRTFNTEFMAMSCENFIPAHANLLTRKWGIRQQALYIKHYE